MFRELRDAAAIRGINDTSPSYQVDPICDLFHICTRISPNIDEEHEKHDVFFLLGKILRKQRLKTWVFLPNFSRGMVYGYLMNGCAPGAENLDFS